MSVLEMQARRDDYFCSQEFEDDMYDLAEEFMDNNHPYFMAYWSDYAWEHEAAWIFKNPDVARDYIIKDFIHKYEDQLQDVLMELFEDNWY